MIKRNDCNGFKQLKKSISFYNQTRKKPNLIQHIIDCL